MGKAWKLASFFVNPDQAGHGFPMTEAMSEKYKDKLKAMEKGGTSGSRLSILKRTPGSAKHVTFVILSLLSIHFPVVESYPHSRRPLINLVFPVLCGIQVRTDNATRVVTGAVDKKRDKI